MSAPFFSIVLPTYNRASHIRQAIASVLQQTFLNFELIIIDDGSSDGTEMEVKNILDKRVRYFYKKNEERSIARNYGIEKASGSYVNFLDSDDIFYRNHLQSAFDLILSKENPEICHLGFEKISATGNVIFKRNDFDDHLVDKMIKENILHCNAIFIKREIALKYHFIHSKEVIISEDWCLWLQLVSRFKIHTSNVVTSAILEHEGRSLNNINVEKLIRSTELVIDALKEDSAFLIKYGSSTRVFYSNQYTFVTLLLSLNKRGKDARYYMLKALREDITVFMRRRFLASIKYLIFPFLINDKF